MITRADWEKKKAEIGEERFYQGLKIVLLQTNDLFWVDHLEMMDYMRGSVNLRAYGQRDPLVEYKREGLRLFKEMQASITAEVLRLLPIMSVSTQPQMTQGPKPIEILPNNTPALPTDEVNKVNQTDVGRNDPCPCGSGKKYKKCHGANL